MIFLRLNFTGETESFWIYVSGSQNMIDDGIIPGAFFAVVDKTDGHIWTRSEQENYYQQKYKPNSKPPRVCVNFKFSAANAANRK